MKENLKKIKNLSRKIRKIMRKELETKDIPAAIIEAIVEEEEEEELKKMKMLMYQMKMKMMMSSK